MILFGYSKGRVFADMYDLDRRVTFSFSSAKEIRDLAAELSDAATEFERREALTDIERCNESLRGLKKPGVSK